MKFFRNIVIAWFCFLTPLIARADQPWVEVSSPHFSVITDAGEKRAKEVGQRFEEMRMAFGVIFNKMSVNTAPLEIVAFRSSKEMKRYSPLYQGKPIDLAGLFLGGGGHGSSGSNNAERQYIALDLSQEDNWGTVFHEYAHLLINSNVSATPLWFDEGFAEYCSSLKVDKKEIDLGLVNRNLAYVLQENSWLKLVDLFSVTHTDKIYNRDDRRSVLYAQSWITVHYFMAKHMMGQVSAYVRYVQDEHQPVPGAIRKAFNMEPEQLDKAISAYFRGGTVSYFKAPAPPNSDKFDFTSRPLNDLELQTILADFDFHARDYRQRGLATFAEILNKQPDNPIANRALGYAALEKGDWDKAEEYFRRAAANDSKDPQVHYMVASGLYRKSMTTGKVPEDLELMKKELNTAIALDPDYADAYGLLGMTLAFSGDKENAVATLKKAIQMNPRNEWNYNNLASVYMRAQDFDNAVPILQQLKSSSNQQIASMAAMQLQSIETYKESMAKWKSASAGPARTILAETAHESEQDRLEEQSTPKPQTVVAKPQPVIYMKGILNSVDCTTTPGAVLTITSAGKKWRMLAPDAKKLSVFGADALSCSWTNKKVNVNYRKTADGEGQLVSLELE